MKKILQKLKPAQKRPETGGRITNETVAEHRERVLAGGRKFKYPLQYTKRRVLIVSIILVVLTTISFVGFITWQLYGVQNTGQFTYRLTQVVPVPVAKVQDQFVRYSDYLLELRSAIHYLTTKEAVNFSSEDGKRQLDYQKRMALDKAIANTFVAKVANAHNVTVSSSELNNFIQKQIASNRLGVSEDVYKQVIRDYYDWSFDEYQGSVRQQLLRQKVEALLDVTDKQKIEQLATQIRQGADFGAVAKASSEDLVSKSQGGDVGFVTRNSDDPSGLIAAAAALQPGQVSGVINGVDGFYLVKLLEKHDNGDVHFAKIFISYKYVDQQIAQLRQKKQIEEYIKVPSISQPTTQ